MSADPDSIPCATEAAAAEITPPPESLASEVLALERAVWLGKAKVDAVDEFGHTLLHRVARADREDLARRLVALGADPSAISVFGYTPIDLAIQAGRGDNAIRFLESVGGTVSVFK